jgi:hypothetical protein
MKFNLIKKICSAISHEIGCQALVDTTERFCSGFQTININPKSKLAVVRENSYMQVFNG